MAWGEAYRVKEILKINFKKKDLNKFEIKPESIWYLPIIKVKGSAYVCNCIVLSPIL